MSSFSLNVPDMKTYILVFLFSEVACSRIACMEMTKTPLHLESTQHFVADQAMKKCHCLLPECSFRMSSTLVEALAQLFGLPVEELRLKVCKVFNLDDRALQTTIEKWLMDHGIMCKEYLRHIVNRCTIVDGLFLWLSVHTSQQHVNVVHPGGIWTSRQSEIVVLIDATITLVVNCFLLSPKMDQFSVQDDSFFIKPLSDPCLVQDNFVIIPHVLNKLVGDIQEWLDETGLYATGPQVLLQENLSRLMECSVVDY